MKYFNDVSQLIGKTPLVKINRLNPYPDTLILAKLERYNPSGSVKDRVAKSMLDDAERRGLLTPDKIILEPTSGNTGIGLAMIAAMKGYQCELVMPESMSVERRKIMLAYGAKVTLTPAEEGTDGAREFVRKRLVEEPGKYFTPNQYDNPANWNAHYENTAIEILQDTEGKVTHFVAGLGTSGTLMGVSRKLRESVQDVQIVAVEPKTGSFIQGLRDLENQEVPNIYDEFLIDQRIRVSDVDAETTARNLGLQEGIFSGWSSGAAMRGAIEVARELDESGIKDGIIVVLLPDSGDKYISSTLYSMTVNAEQPSTFQTKSEAVCCS